MLKKDLLDLIFNFEKETWKYNSNENLDKDMDYIYSIENAIKNASDTNLKLLYDRLVALIGIIRLKYGFESIVINSIPELENLKNEIDGIDLSDNEIITKFNRIINLYNSVLSKIVDVDFIKNNYEGIQGKEGLYLAVESLKSLITNTEYRALIGDNQINSIIVDCISLNMGIANIKILESKYKEIINSIWARSLTNEINENNNFRFLFSNISGGTLSDGAIRLINRPNQSSCSMISSNFIATYGDETRKIGFIYPSNSDIIMASAYDLGSNVFGEGSVNKEKGTILVTPQVLEKIGKARAIKNGEDIYSSSCYNEVLVNAKPCAIVVIGLGESDLNIDYQDAIMLSSEMNLPIYYIDIMKYKSNLSETDKNYMAFHSLMSYVGMSRNELLQQVEQNNGCNEIYNLIKIYKEELVDIFQTLKRDGNLSKYNMCQAMSSIIEIPKKNGKNK